MVFVRTKTIKGKPYAYLVENKWTLRGSRQISTKYLGRVISLQKVRDLPFSTYFPEYSIQQKNKKELLRDALMVTLLGYGFQLQKRTLRCKNIVLDLETMTLKQKSGKAIALALGEGILCSETIARISNYAKSEDDEGYMLAKHCIEAGLNIPKELFVALYEASSDSA